MSDTIHVQTKTETPDGDLELFIKGVRDEDRVITLDDLLEKFGVTRDEFEVVSFKPNSWENHLKVGDDQLVRVVNYQAKAILRPHIQKLTTQEVAKLFREMVGNHSPKYTPVRRKESKVGLEDITVVMDLFDLHIGMLAWGQETLGEDWDSHIGVEMALQAIEELVDRLQGFNITKIIVPMGNDLLHTDTTVQGKGGTTTSGTPQDVDTRYLKMFRMAHQLMVAMIDRLRQIAPVKVLVVPGNHDRERAAYLGEVIYAWYRNDPEVEVDNGASLRKYELVGDTLLGFTHGDQERAENLPMIMASEKPMEWAASKFRVFHTGHFHKKRKMLTVTTDTYNGVEVLTLPSLVPPDAWHAMKGYVGGGRAAEAHLVGDISGPCGYFRFNAYSGG